MAVNEEIVTGKKFRRLIDVATNKWRRYSFWNKAKDTECEDGTDVETKVGAIKGITTSTNVSETGYAADAKTVSEINQSLTKINEGKEPAKKVYGAWNSERSNEVTIDTSGFRNGVYIIFNTYTDVKPLVEFIVKTNGKIATTNISMDSSINGDKITYACGNFWCMFFAKMIEPLG